MVKGVAPIAVIPDTLIAGARVSGFRTEAYRGGGAGATRTHPWPIWAGLDTVAAAKRGKQR